MIDSRLAHAAAEQARQRVHEVLVQRTRALRRRAQVLAAREAGGPRQAPPADRLSPLPEPASLVQAGDAGLVLAEGDSWFDYPMHDVLQALEDDHGFEVETLARAGDSLESMAYDEGQLRSVSRRLESLLRRGRRPKAVLVSGGGNDVAGAHFAMLLDHAEAQGLGLNEAVVAGVIDQRLARSLLTIVYQITELSQHWLGEPVPIIVHGYDHPVPDGRGVPGAAGVQPGPWLEPGFRDKGFGPLPVRKGIARMLIDRLNRIQAEVARMPGLEHVVHLDLRGTLSSGDDYRQYWADEMHPTAHGFALVAARFAEVLRGR